jgi:hypothetical protein
MQRYGLEIRYCEDLKSYKKIIPTLKVAPDAFIVTADDDVYYWPTWLEELVLAYRGDTLEVLCHRAHKIRLDRKLQQPLPYDEWDLEIEEASSSPLIFPTGVGGVFYPPFVFHPDVFREDIYQQYCAGADDVWLYWMARRRNAKIKKIGVNKPLLTWPATQENALWIANVIEGGNDAQISAMIQRFGFPSVEKNI